MPHRSLILPNFIPGRDVPKDATSHEALSYLMIYTFTSLVSSTNTPLYSARGYRSAKRGHCTKNRSTIGYNIFPLKLKVLTLAKLSTYTVLVFARPKNYSIISRFSDTYLYHRSLTFNAITTRINNTALPGPFVTTTSGTPVFRKISTHPTKHFKASQGVLIQLCFTLRARGTESTLAVAFRSSQPLREASNSEPLAAERESPEV